MCLSQTILLNRCINQLFFNQEKVDTSTKFFSELGNQHLAILTFVHLREEFTICLRYNFYHADISK